MISKSVPTLMFLHLLSGPLVLAVQQEWGNVRNEMLVDLLLELKDKHRYQTVLFENCAENLSVNDFWAKMNTPMLQLLSTTQYERELKMLFNHNLLAIVCVESYADSSSVLSGLAKQLQLIRHSHIILLVLGVSASKVHQEEVVEQLFRHCQRLQMLNVIALFRDYMSTRVVFTFDAFPTFKLNAFQFSALFNYFPDKTRQLHGHPIYTLPDQNQPRSFLFRDANGELKMSGYVGKLVEAFGQHINGSLRFPYPININENIYQREQLNSTRTGVIDFATSLGSYKFFAVTSEFTYPFEFAKWLMMLPVERELEVNEMLLYIFQSELFMFIILIGILVSFFLNAFEYFQIRPHSSERKFWTTFYSHGQTFRGILGQPFPMYPYNNWRMSVIYFTIFLIGLITSCLFSVYLKTFLTQPPTKPRINSLDDLIKSDTRCLINEKEVPVFKEVHGEDAWSHYKAGFEVISSWPKFLAYRLSLNTTYAYTVTTSLWPIIQLKQSLRRRKLFRLATDIVLDDTLVLAIPIQENSIYKSALNRFIMSVNEAGLIYYWQVMTYYDMVAIGSINLEYNVDGSRQQNILIPSDFYWMAWMFGVSYSLSIIVFVFEVLIYKFKR
ncbi:uncharacterized protein LOC105221503 [Zeugodacus cucurbitae]|uniref:uncharacterized protein LOC105221503 n=1 Tax=Zeugodacus cucurbitae TaxID=28588 RepID=UPI0023D90455|nr:uncharacterized protein LOC105221503 [Zeugodacus cucurbitae]